MMDQCVPEYMADIVRSTSSNRQGYRDRAARLLSLDTQDPPMHWHKCVTAAWEFQALLMEDKKFTSQVTDAAKRFNKTLLSALTVEGAEVAPEEPPKSVDPMVLGVCEVLETLSDSWKKSNPAWRLRRDELESRLNNPKQLALSDNALNVTSPTPRDFLEESDSPIYVLEALSEEFISSNPESRAREKELTRLLRDPKCLKETQKAP